MNSATYPQRSRATDKLTDKQVRDFIRRGERRKLADGAGLYLTLTPAGRGVWRLKYRLPRQDGAVEKVYTLGSYPEISLQAAREERTRLRQLVVQGRDLAQLRKKERLDRVTASANTFRAVAEEWLASKRVGWQPVHYEKSKQALERDVYPLLGDTPVAEIEPKHVAVVIDGIVERGARDTAGKVLQHIGRVFKYAQSGGLCRDNPAEPVTERLPRRTDIGKQPALLEVGALREVLARCNPGRLSRPLSHSVWLAHRLCAFTATRIGNVVTAEWSEFDLDAENPTWTIPRAKMKKRDRDHDHRVYLGATIARELREWQKESRRNGRIGGYVFPSPADGTKHVTRESLEKVYRVTLGLKGKKPKHSLHGWRSSFSTLAKEAGFSHDAVELALDHVHANKVARAYDRGERLAERIEVARWWDAQLSGNEQHDGSAETSATG